MGLPKFQTPFVRIDLNTASGSEFRHLAQGLVTDAIDEYEHFLWRQHETIDRTQWSQLREHDEMRVYQHQHVTKHKMQELLLAGTMLGEMDDALYGVVSLTTDAMRQYVACTKDRIANCAVLATIKKPTRSKPFRSLTIKWFVHDPPLHVRAFTGKKTDMVVLDCTGTKTLSNGETVGFQLLHSIDLATTPPLSRYERANLSVCTLWRQKTDDRVQLYAHAFAGSSDKTKSIRTTSDRLLATARSIQCAHIKKLMWLMRCKTSILGDSHGDLRGRGSQVDGECEICPTHNLHAGRRSAKAACTVCTRLVCSSCRVKRELCTITAEHQLVEQRMAFCTPCHTIAMRAAAVDVASDEIVHSAREHDESTRDDSFVFFSGGLADDDSDSSNGVGALDFQDVDQYKKRSTRKSVQSSSIGGTQEDSETDCWSPAARHRAGAELASLYIMGDA